MRAITLTTKAFGSLCGATGIIAGVFLVLQGDDFTNGFKISYIGSSFLMWKHDTYMAFTLIPNYLISGIVTLVLSTALLVWTNLFIHTRRGSLVFLLLSIAQMLSGGGFVMDLAQITFLLSLGIRGKLNWWSNLLSGRFGKFLGCSWLPSIICYSALSIVMLGITVAGINSPEMMNLMEIMAAVMFFPILFMIFGSLARDLEKHPGKTA